MNKNDHEKITKFATKNFKHLFTSEFKKLLEVEEKRSYIAEGSKKEDEGVFVRSKNWHFYRAENSHYLKPFPLLLGLGTIHPSSRNRFIEHTTTLANKRDTSNIESIFLLAGRIIHHIQDMSTPAHVIPIYHGPTIYPVHFPSKKDGFENFSENHIDNYLQTSKISITHNDQDRIIKESNNNMISLYDLVANRTLEYLESDNACFKAKVNGIEKTVTPDLFWLKFDPIEPHNDKRDGWGRYGPFGEVIDKKCYFGVPSSTKKYNGDNYSISFSNYKHIYTYLLKQMVVDTLTVLLYVEKNILKLRG